MTTAAIAALAGPLGAAPVQPSAQSRPAAVAATGGGPTFAATLARATPPAPGLAGRVLLDTALRHLGAPPAPRSPGSDAGAAFVADAHRRVGVLVPDDVAGQTALGVPVPSLAQARSGDLVVLGGDPAQVGLYAGGGRILHAPTGGGPVQLSVIDAPVTAIRRIVSAAPTEEAAAAPVMPVAAGTLPVATVLAGRAPAAVPVAGGAGLAGVPYAELFQQAGAAHGIDPALLAAVARIESGFNPGATSPAGAIGLMQFMPGTAAGLGVDPRDPASAVDGAARYLRQGLDRFGTVELALAAYNAGPGAVQRHGGIPPYPETQAYVRKVLDAKEQYR